MTEPIAASRFGLMFAAAMLLCSSLGCRGAGSHQVQGYVEGEYVYVASPLAGELELLGVERGDQVKAGQELFALEDAAERASRDEALQRLAQSQAELLDAQKGKRPTEIDSLRAQLGQAQADLAYSETELARQEKLKHTRGAATEQEYDQARFGRDQDRARIVQLQADLATAELGARDDQIAAAAAKVAAMEAALKRAEWDLAQKRQSAAAAGLVVDTLYRRGEWVPAGRPVVMLLPPQNIKVRAFVPEPLIGTVHPGDAALVKIDGVLEPHSGKVSFISPRAEYTPPVIYSRESRSKLVFMIEVAFAPETASRLNPGQPVDVVFGS